MKRAKLLGAAVFIAFTSIAADLSKMPYHPWRIVDNKYCCLVPMYVYVNTGCNGPSPMNWIGFSVSSKMAGPGQNPNGSPAKYYTIAQVLHNGLMVQKRWRYDGPMFGGQTTSDMSGGGEYFFLTNYPYLSQCVDGQRIQFLAVKTGNYQYESASGLRTVAMYDYGVPCQAPADPKQPPPTNTVAPYSPPPNATTRTNSEQQR